MERPDLRRARSQAQREGLGFDLVSTSGLKIASCLAQEEQESLTSPLSMGKSALAKKSEARSMSGPFLPQPVPFFLALWPMERAILKEEGSLTLGYLTKDLRDFPKEKRQAGRFWGRAWPGKA